MSVIEESLRESKCVYIPIVEMVFDYQEGFPSLFYLCIYYTYYTACN